MVAFALTLVLTTQPCTGMGPVDRFTDCVLFRSPQEAANASAHVAWSMAIPLAGHAAAGKKGALVAGSAWLAYSVVNELVLHGPEAPRERNLNLLTRIAPCAAIMLWEVLR